MIEFGKTLRTAREAKGLTPGQIAERTHMMIQVVEGLENENFSKIVAPIYGRGFVKLYCEAVGLEPKPLVDAFIKDRPLEFYSDEADYGFLRIHVLPSGRRILYRAGMIYGGASFVGYDPSSRTLVVILRNVTSWPDRRGFEVMERILAFWGCNSR